MKLVTYLLITTSLLTALITTMLHDGGTLEFGLALKILIPCAIVFFVGFGMFISMERMKQIEDQRLEDSLRNLRINMERKCGK